MRFSSLVVTGLMCGLSGTAMSQTEPLARDAATLPGVEVAAPKQVARHHKSGTQVATRNIVAHGVAPARTSVASLNTPPVYGRDTLATTTGNCSTTTWPVVSPVQCTKPVARNYVECTEMVAKGGNRPSDGWWWCSNQGFKN
jgi:hypothetical protein